jgi:hypothetical protein
MGKKRGSHNRLPRRSRSGRLGRRPQSAASNSRCLPHLSSRRHLSELLVASEDGNGGAFKAGLLLGSDGAVFCARGLVSASSSLVGFGDNIIKGLISLLSVE